MYIGMVWYSVFDTHSSTYQTAYTEACKTYRIITVNTTVFLEMNR